MSNQLHNAHLLTSRAYQELKRFEKTENVKIKRIHAKFDALLKDLKSLNENPH